MAVQQRPCPATWAESECQVTPLREKPDAPELPRCYLPPLWVARRNWLEWLLDLWHDWKAR